MLKLPVAIRGARNRQRAGSRPRRIMGAGPVRHPRLIIPSNADGLTRRLWLDQATDLGQAGGTPGLKIALDPPGFDLSQDLAHLLALGRAGGDDVGTLDRQRRILPTPRLAQP